MYFSSQYFVIDRNFVGDRDFVDVLADTENLTRLTINYLVMLHGINCNLYNLRCSAAATY